MRFLNNSIGTNVVLTLFGESHGESIGAVLDGLPAGIDVDIEFIKSQLLLRSPIGEISTPRHEEDNFIIHSGVFEGKTTGTPICIAIPNENTKSKDYSKTRFALRPGHADYTANIKYGGFEDYRGGGHFSGRVTAGIVAAGAIAIKTLAEKGILIGTHEEFEYVECEHCKSLELINIPQDIGKYYNEGYIPLIVLMHYKFYHETSEEFLFQ